MEIKSAKAIWDAETNPAKPVWVVEVVHDDGDTDIYSAAPSVECEGPQADSEHIVAKTIEWQGWTVTG